MQGTTGLGVEEGRRVYITPGGGGGPLYIIYMYILKREAISFEAGRVVFF